MPGVAPFVGRTEEEAQEKYDRLTSLIVEEDGLALISGLTGRRARPHGVRPRRPAAAAAADRGHEEPAGADPPDRRRERASRSASSTSGSPRRAGTTPSSAAPTQIADALQDWFENEAADGFNILPPWLPTALDDFVDLVIPELQRRGLFRTAYEGRTLRENLGLPFPLNAHAAARAAAHAAE